MGTSISGRTCTPTLSSLVAPPCTPELPTECRRRSLPWLPLHLPADVDLQAGVRRVWPLHCAQEVFLRSLQLQATSATLPPCDLGRPPDIKCRVLVVFCLV